MSEAEIEDRQFAKTPPQRLLDRAPLDLSGGAQLCLSDCLVLEADISQHQLRCDLIYRDCASPPRR